jgi:hypothetical protein
MQTKVRSQLALGLLLILAGAWFFAVQVIPGLGDLFQWPSILIGFGVLLLVLGLVVNAPGLAIPATIITGIGGLLAWQNATGHWESWAYAWALIPGFVGVGIVLMGALEGTLANRWREGGTLILISLIMFAIFGSFLGGLGTFGPYWPLLLVVLGLILLGQSLLGRRQA